MTAYLAGRVNGLPLAAIALVGLGIVGWFAWTRRDRRETPTRATELTGAESYDDSPEEWARFNADPESDRLWAELDHANHPSNQVYDQEKDQP